MVARMYRENIYDVISSIGVPVSTLVVPKNSGLKGYAWKVLQEAGLDLAEAIQVSETEMKAKDDVTVQFRRGEDIPQVVMDEFRLGRVVLGITGDDLLDEYLLRNPDNTLKIENTYDWFDLKAKFFRPALCFIGKTGNLGDMPENVKVALNGKYEHTSRLFLAKDTRFAGKRFLLTVYAGDLEDRVKSGSSDYCIDTVYSGDTIKDLGLVIVNHPIRFTDVVVISPLRSKQPSALETIASGIPQGHVIDRTAKIS